MKKFLQRIQHRARLTVGLLTVLILTLGLSLIGTLPAGAAQNYAQDAGLVFYTNALASGVNIASGDLIDISNRYGVALNAIPTGTAASVATEGQWKFVRAESNAIVAGQMLFYSSATQVTATAAAGTYVGLAAQSYSAIATGTLAAGSYVTVDLNASLGNDVIGTDVQAYSANLAAFATNGISRTNAIVSTITNFNVTIINGRIVSWTVQ